MGPPRVPLPAMPSHDFLSERAWEVLFALLDGVLPSIAPKSKITDERGQLSVDDAEFQRVVEGVLSRMSERPTAEEVEEFLSYRPAQDADFRADCVRYLSRSHLRANLSGMMNFLGTHIGSLILTGHWWPVDQQPVRVRHAIMRSWSRSRFRALRGLAKSLCGLAQKTHAATNPRFKSLLGFSDAPADWKPAEGHYEYDFIQLEADDGTDAVHEITTDVVIVGSGPGGGVSAKNLAEAGHRVLVVDKGYHFAPSQLPLTQQTGSEYLFESGGLSVSDSTAITTLRASCWGGGGTVNWSVCLRPQDFVREEWAAEGLPLFTSKEFDECIDRVWEFIGAGRDAIRHNHRNELLLNATARLGWHGSPCDQNTAGREHYCGHCHLGCGLGEKRGPATSWLPAAGKAGAEFMEGFQANRVLFDDEDGEGSDGVRTAVGVEGIWTSRDAEGGIHKAASERTQRRVVIKAKRVVLSAGTMWSPVILMKSGIKNPHLGQNLHLHPATVVTAIHKELTRPWEGGIITSLSTEFEKLDGKGYGVKLEPTLMLPYAFAGSPAWISGLDAKLLSLRYKHASSFISLGRDRDAGRVYADAVTGRPRFDYTPSQFDAANVVEGVAALAKICYAGGATEIRANMMGVGAFSPDAAAQERLGRGEDPEMSDQAFARWLGRVREVGAAGVGNVTFTSAHQMGTCRMSKGAGGGVVDDGGKVWGTEGLYVADASVFPGASGVNPMVTVMSIADWISRGIARGMMGEQY